MFVSWRKSPKPGPSALWPPSCGRPYPLKVSPSAVHGSIPWVGWRKRDPGNPRLPIGFFCNCSGGKNVKLQGGVQYSLIHWILRVFLVLTELQICGAVFLGGTLQAHRNGIDMPNVSVWIASIMTFDICNHLLTAPHLDLFHLSSNFFIDLQHCGLCPEGVPNFEVKMFNKNS